MGPKTLQRKCATRGNPCGQIGGDLLTVKLVMCGGKEPPHVYIYIYIYININK